MFKTGQIVSKATLRETFDVWVTQVLVDRLKSLPVPPRARAKFEVLSDLPTVEEYKKLRDQKFSTTLGDLLSDGKSEIESLKDELQEWHDNLPESFQNGDKGQQIDDATSTLDNAVSTLDGVELPESISELKVVHLPRSGGSRSDRRDEAVAQLQLVVDKLQERIDEIQANQDDASVEVEAKEDDSDYESAKDSLEEAIGEIEGVEFPGWGG